MLTLTLLYDDHYLEDGGKDELYGNVITGFVRPDGSQLGKQGERDD
jgi:hypothetical protein